MNKRHIFMGAIALCGVVALSLGTVSYASSYTVVKGDNLWKIAKEKLGDGARFTEIFEANKDQIKDPNKIQIGQVLEIPDGQSDPVSDNSDQTSVDNSDTASMEEADFLTQMKGLINDLNTLGVGETKTVEMPGTVATATKATENVLVTDFVISSDTAINSKIRTFTCKTDYGYQMAIYYTHKDGTQSCVVYYIPEDGSNADILYLSADTDIDEKMTIQMSDIMADGEGYIEITPDTEGLEPGEKDVFIEIYDAQGNIVKEGFIYSVTEGNINDTHSVLMTETSDIVGIYYHTEGGDSTLHELSVTDVYGVGTLTFKTDANLDVIMDSVSYEAYDPTGDMSYENYESTRSLFNGLDIGEEDTKRSAGFVNVLKRVSENAIVEKTLYKDKIISQNIVLKSPEGEFLMFEDWILDDDTDFIGFITSEDILYASVIDDISSGEETYDIALNPDEKFTLKTVTSENSDGTKTRTGTYLDADGNILNETVVTISEDGSTYTAESVTAGVTYKITYIIKDGHVTVTLDTGKDNIVIDYDVRGNEIVSDSVKVAFK